jgi:hypothetical protein
MKTASVVADVHGNIKRLKGLMLQISVPIFILNGKEMRKARIEIN